MPAGHHGERCARTGLHGGLVGGEQRAAVAVAQAAAGAERGGVLAGFGAEPERVECEDAVGHQADAGPVLARLGRPFQHRDVVPGPLQRDRRREPAEPGPDHQYVHRTPPLRL